MAYESTNLIQNTGMNLTFMLVFLQQFFIFQVTVYPATIAQALFMAPPDILSPSVVHLKHSGFSSYQHSHALLTSHFTPSVYSSVKESCQ